MTDSLAPSSSEESIAARVQRAIGHHGLDNAGSLTDVIERAARHRGRPIELEPMPDDAPAGHVFGVCLPYPDRDLILFRAGAGADHELHSILHECGHLLLDHVATARGQHAALDASRLSALLPDLDPELVASALARSGYEDTQEREAETFAMLVRALIQTQRRRRGDAILSRFDDALG